MPHYLFAYYGGKQPDSPEEGAKSMERWKAWVGNLGDAMINPGTPVGKSTIVGADGISDDDGSNPLLGFSTVKAENLEAALAMAKACPYVEQGTIHVAEMRDMQ